MLAPHWDLIFLDVDLISSSWTVVVYLCICVVVYLCLFVFGKTKEAISLLRKLGVCLSDHWRKATTEGALPKTPLMLLVQSPPSSSSPCQAFWFKLYHIQCLLQFNSSWVKIILRCNICCIALQDSPSMTIYYRHGPSQIISLRTISNHFGTIYRVIFFSGTLWEPIWSMNNEY